MSLSTEVYVSIGSNVGDRLLNLKSAGSALKNISKSVEFSDVYISTARGFITQPEFFNAACKLTTILSPWNFLDQIRTIEKNHGRYRIFPNAPRSIDIDLILWGGFSVKTSVLEIPHPRFRERAFVLLPLMDLNPFAVDPITKNRIRDFLGEIGDRNRIESIGQFPL